MAKAPLTEAQMRALGYNENVIRNQLAATGQQYSGTATPAAAPAAPTPAPAQTAAPAAAPAPAAPAAPAFDASKNMAIMQRLGVPVPSAGKGEVQDALARNPNLVNQYVSARQAYEPNYTYNATPSAALNAKDSALAQAQAIADSMGIPFDRISGQVSTAASNILNSVPYGTAASSAGSYFDPNSLVSNAANTVLSQERAKLGRQINSSLPNTYADTALPNTLDDDIIGQILGEQFGTAQTQLDREKARGRLTDLGYQSALSNLTNQRSAASSRLQSVGGDLLSGYRSQINDLINEGKTKASAYDFGSDFDAGALSDRVGKTVQELSGGLGGALRNVLGGEQFINVNGALQSGFSGQGAQNTSREGTLAALAGRERERTAKRGVGGSGVF